MRDEDLTELLARPEGDGICLFESGVPGREACNVLAVDPERVLVGSLHREEDRDALREELAAQRKEVPVRNRPGLYGWVDYDGDFVLGRFDKVSTWEGVRAVAKKRSDWPIVSLRPEQGAAHFEGLVRRALDYIAAGDIYQVNLARRFSGALASGQRDFRWLGGLYENLRRESPVPFAALASFGGRSLISASPECFLRMSGRTIETRPIKGTAARRRGREADEVERAKLLGSEKERAELLMITDLERNDLGRSCEFGSVKVTDLAVIESYAHLHHMVSRVRGTLRTGTDHIDALALAFPGGSVTGAPKKRAMEIIAELEGFQRGAYTGAIGWLGAHGFSQFNIAIRTFECREDSLLLHTGSGIVADSDPSREAQETMLKARALFSAAGARWHMGM